MKKIALTSIATLAIAAGALAQGLVTIDNSASYNPGVADVTAGTYYSGPFGMEVWGLNAAAVPSGINGAANTAAYSVISASPWTMPAEYNGTLSQGTFSGLGTATFPTSPAGSSVVIALAVWNNSATSWAAGVATAGAHAGVVAFVNPTVAPTSSGPPAIPAALTGWTSGDLVMTSVTTVPEPGTLALAGLGLASLLVLRRRK